MLRRLQLRGFAVVIVFLLLVELSACGESSDQPVQLSEFDLATRLRWVLQPNWTLEQHDQEFIISRKELVRSHTCVGLDLGLLRDQEAFRRFIDEWGTDITYKIRLQVGARMDLIQHAQLTESNSSIRVTKSTVIPNREFFEEEAMRGFDSNYRQLPDYYDQDSSIYVESNLHPWECIYPGDVARECAGIISRLDLLFSRYPGARSLRPQSWLST